ncbi:unnamed protein product [Ectocarpus sp. 13 AM-2016]
MCACVWFFFRRSEGGRCMVVPKSTNTPVLLHSAEQLAICGTKTTVCLVYGVGAADCCVLVSISSGSFWSLYFFFVSRSLLPAGNVSAASYAVLLDVTWMFVWSAAHESKSRQTHAPTKADRWCGRRDDDVKAAFFPIFHTGCVLMFFSRVCVCSTLPFVREEFCLR